MTFTYPQQQGHPLSARNKRRVIQIKSNRDTGKRWSVFQTEKRLQFFSLLTKLVKFRYSFQCSKLEADRMNSLSNPRTIWKLHTKSQAFLDWRICEALICRAGIYMLYIWTCPSFWSRQSSGPDICSCCPGISKGSKNGDFQEGVDNSSIHRCVP